jgi:diguanylate cyclase (GGDEF)-like protein
MGSQLKARLERLSGKLPSLATFGAHAPMLVVLLSFYTAGILRESGLPGYIYLFLALVLMTSGVLGLRTGSLPILLTIALGEAALALAGGFPWYEGVASAAGLVLAATAIPLIARSKLLAMTAAQNRLTRAQLEARMKLGERLAVGATPNPAAAGSQPVAITESLVRSLILPAKKALSARTAIFYWYNEEQDCLVPVESVSDCPELLNHASIAMKQGKLTSLKTRREPTSFRFSPHEDHYLPIYSRKVQVAGVMAVPVHLKGRLAGALVLDRAGNEPFFLPDTVMARRLGEALEESLAAERRLQSSILLSQQLRMMDEAARQFANARTFDQVYDTAVRYAVSFTPFRRAVLAHRITSASDEFEVVGVNRKELAGLLGKQFPLAGSLCQLASNSRTHLPANFVFDTRMPQPFGKDIGLELEADEPCAVIPLTIRDEAVGFLLLADSPKPVVADDLVSLFLFAEYCAVSLVNAEANKELERMATLDPLTGIHNHRAFRSRMGEAWQRAERTKKELSILFLDIDHFKSINDTHGHAVGDIVLKRIARTMEKAVRKMDFAARYGGEEFVVVMEETGRAGAITMAERLLQAVARLEFEEMGSSRITVSIGVATYPRDSQNADELLELADAALYKAKNSGRNCCQAV